MGEVHSVPIVSSDFVYAALSEELGFAGCSIVLILWLILLLLPLISLLSSHGDSPRKNGDSPRKDGKNGDSPPMEIGSWLLSVGLVTSLGCQLLLNVAGVLNVLPMTGITFPLLSHGGSSLVAVLAMCGILNAADSS